LGVNPIAEPETKKKLSNAGGEIQQSAQEFADYARSETTKWERVIKAANIKVE